MEQPDLFRILGKGSAVSADPTAGVDDGVEESDAALAVLAREGDPDAFMTLVNRYRDRAYWISYHLIGRHEDARDIVQDAFIRVYQALGRYDRRRKFYNYLYQIVVNLSIDHLRRRNYADGLPLDEIPPPTGRQGGPEEETTRKERAAAVREILDLLPARHKVVLVLRHIEGFDCRQIAQVVRCTYATARWRLHRARQVFKDAWTARYGTEEGVER